MWTFHINYPFSYSSNFVMELHTTKYNENSTLIDDHVVDVNSIFLFLIQINYQQKKIAK